MEVLLQAQQLSSVSLLCSRHTRAGCHCRLPPCQEPPSPAFSPDPGSCSHPVREDSLLLPPISSHCHPSQPRVSSSISDSRQPSSLSSALACCGRPVLTASCPPFSALLLPALGAHLWGAQVHPSGIAPASSLPGFPQQNHTNSDWAIFPDPVPLQKQPLASCQELCGLSVC